MKRTWAIVLMLLMSFAVSTGCSKHNPVAPASTQVQGAMLFSLAAANNIASGVVTITKGGIAETLPVAINSNTGSVQFDGIQVGTWNILVQLFDAAGVEIYSGSGTALVSKDSTTTVNITVEENTGNLLINVNVPVNDALVVYRGADGYICTSDLQGNLLETFNVGTEYGYYGYISNFRGGTQLLMTAGPSWFPCYLVEFDGSDFHQSGTAHGEGARWSWDGSMIAGTNYGSGTYIVRSNADGSNGLNLPLTNGQGQDRYPCWTQDNHILYNHYEEVSGTQHVAVYITDLNGASQVAITDLLLDVYVTDCDATDKLLVNYNGQVCLMNIDGSELTSLAAGNNGYFSADGSRIVYVSGGTELHVMNRDGSQNQIVPLNGRTVVGRPSFRF